MNTTTQTTIDPHGLVTISGNVKRNGFYAAGEPDEPPYYIENLTITDSNGNTLQGKKIENGKCYNVCSLDQWQIDNCEEVLIEKFTDEEASALDYLIDEAIERGRECARNAYA